MQTVYTIGHSTRPIEQFIELLKEQEVKRLLDIRTVPKSRHNPQFGQDALAGALAQAGIEYRYIGALGGLRRARKDSTNDGWRNQSFRGYADHMQQIDFNAAVDDVARMAGTTPCALMCAEAVPWRCHRSLVADALLVRGIRVEHIINPGKTRPHVLTPFAQVAGRSITYPAPAAPAAGTADASLHG
ncbi:DUF488 domain-containing protein [Pseudoduganella buxea]|uniref:DUF488 family protein n=1 Tax=Pseudoduganella buxea TaxID=1949069 RepID=A0A6I3SXT1_9BURK|nr:DUF488 domain-containing protein [Pseudoduganella buxea]MTV54131.1 DUF488 family protein [Pseudoduganella buxea]GGC14170.1 hypothetical protein GCM10011572_39520 [Pseudoduganella buxea]